MDGTDFKRELAGIGFSETESSVYLSLLGLGSATNSQIARVSGLNRITNFEVLKRLMKQGVVSGFKMKGVMYFGALNPDILIRERVSGLEKLRQGLTEIVKNKNNTRKPKITEYSGKDGLKRIYAESLQSRGEILTWTHSEQVRSYFGQEFVDSYVKDRVRKGIKVRGFAPDTETGQADAREGESVLREVKLLQNSPINNEIMLFDDSVALFSTTDEMGIIIKNKSISESIRGIWQTLWDKS